MLIQCSHCGAPLDVSEGQRVAKCAYCKSSNDVARTRTLSAETPGDWKPPSTWTPPDDVRAPSRPLQYRSSGLPPALLFGGVAAVVVVASGAAFVAMSVQNESTGAAASTTATESPRAPIADIAALGLDTTAAELRQRIPFAQVDGASAAILVAGAGLERVHVEWNEAGDRIVSVSFTPAEGANPREVALGRLRPVLGRKLAEASSGYTTASYAHVASVSVSEDGVVAFGCAPEEGTTVALDSLCAALWVVARNAALQTSLPLAAADAERLRGYTLTRIAEADVTSVVDEAYTTIAETLPGVSGTTMITRSLYVDSDHPRFSGVTFDYANEAGGRLESMQVWSRGEELDDLDAIAACLEPVLGEPEIDVTDHLAGTRRFFWNRHQDYYATGGTMGANSLWLPMSATEDAQERTRAILAALDPCR